jgi:Actinobacteria/chloroflexi VLRF1 release factor
VNADRVVRVPAERLPGWVERFTTRHGEVVVTRGPDLVVLTAADGARAALTVPFPPLAESPDPLGALLEHAGRDRLIGALLVRRGGYAVGVFAGSELRSSKVGHGYVQGRTKAGGWSQQRFARRRSNQADRAYAAAAEAAYAVLGPVAGDLVAVVGGGDRSGVDAVLADPRLAPVRARLTDRVLPTPDPRLDVLRRFGETAREVEITLNALA